MAATKSNHQKNDEAPLKGTWISVTVVGVVILATNLLLFGLYMARF